MLKPNELLELVRAGYSKAEIEAMNTGEANEGVNDETEADAGSNQEASADDIESIDALINKHVDDAFTKLNASVDAFNKKLENFNVMNAEMSSAMQEASKKESIEDILLGSILLPNGEEKGEK